MEVIFMLLPKIRDNKDLGWMRHFPCLVHIFGKFRRYYCSECQEFLCMPRDCTPISQVSGICPTCYFKEWIYGTYYGHLINKNQTSQIRQILST